jgi:flagellar hook-associated protein 2
MAITASTGLISQIDYKALLESLMQIKREPINLMFDRKEKLEDTDSAYDELATKLEEFKTAAAGLLAYTDFNDFKASVSDESIMSVTAGETATAGTHTVVVNNLATSHKIYTENSTYTSADDTIGATDGGTFGWMVGTTSYSVSVDSTTTLQDLSDSINAATTDSTVSDVTSTVIFDGTNYHMTMTSQETGTTEVITLENNNTELFGGPFDDTADPDISVAGTYVLQVGTNASLTVDGLAITSETNNVDGIIQGVTLNLESADAAKTITVTIARDAETIKLKAVDLAEKYNGIMSLIKQHNRYDSDTKTSGVFFGDSTARSVADELRRLMTSEVDGVDSGMSRLVYAGFTMDVEGKLTVNSSDLTDAIENDFDNFVRLFIDGNSIGESTNGMASLITNLIDDMTAVDYGRVASRQRSLSNIIDTMEKDIIRQEDLLADYQEKIRLQFVLLEGMVASLREQGNYLASFMR